MNMIIMWIVIGTIIGIASNMVEVSFSSKSVGMSIILGVIGASMGGIMGELLSHAGNGSMWVSPMLYIVMGAFLTAMVPSKSNIL